MLHKVNYARKKVLCDNSGNRKLLIQKFHDFHVDKTYRLAKFFIQFLSLVSKLNWADFILKFLQKIHNSLNDCLKIS